MNKNNANAIFLYQYIYSRSDLLYLLRGRSQLSTFMKAYTAYAFWWPPPQKRTLKCWFFSNSYLLTATCTIYTTHWSFHIYMNTSWIPGFARDPLSRSLSPSLSRPSLLFVPACYPPSLGLPGFAQDNCIPEILFKPWSLVTLKFSPLTPPPPSDGVGWGLYVLVIFSGEFFLLIFSAVREISRIFEIWTPQPPPDAGPPGVEWVNICFIYFLDIHGSHWHWLIEGSENDVITSTDSLWRHLPHNGSQKKLAAKSRFGDWPQWPHASRPFMGPIFGRNHSQVYPHMRAKFGHDRSSSLAAYTWQTDTQNLYYIDIDNHKQNYFNINKIHVFIIKMHATLHRSTLKRVKMHVASATCEGPL